MKKVLFSVIAALFCCYGLALASGGGGHWGYAGEGGPEHWGDLSPQFAACKEGRKQSPVDLTGMVDVELPAIEFAYGMVPLEVLNNGHTIQANYAAGSRIAVAGQTYDLLQFHFHSPSENTINGRSFPLEAHLVHKAADGRLAVVAVMFEEGATNAVLEKVWKVMPAEEGSVERAENESVSVDELLPASRDYYAFDGSLTTPPCTEGVKWMVLKQPMTVSPEQVQHFVHTLHGPNNRPVQPLYGRTVSE
jgi:carbonic anhydrase